MRIDLREKSSGIASDGLPIHKHRAYLNGEYLPAAFMADEEAGIVGVYRLRSPLKLGDVTIDTLHKHIEVDPDTKEAKRDYLCGNVEIRAVASERE